MIRLFDGAAVTARARLGFVGGGSEGLLPDPGESASHFAEWARTRSSDPDLSGDLRAMVPVFFDKGRGQWKVWAFLGWTNRPIEISFDRPPRVTAIDEAGRPLPEQPRVIFTRREWRTPYAVSSELYVDRLLDRDEFRRVCDSGRTAEGITSRLS